MTTMARVVALAGVALSASLAATPVSRAQGPDAVHLAGRAAGEAEALRQTMRAAERAATGGEWADARRLYEGVVREELAQGRIPIAAMWRLATVLEHAGEPLAAAELLDEVAKLAAEHALTTVEVSALFEGGRYYERAGRPEEAAARVALGVARMRSPDVPEARRAELLKRLDR